MICIDFGSGYNPKEGYKSCDFTSLPNLDYYYDGNKIINLECKVNKFYIRNVLHHIHDIDILLNYLIDCLHDNGVIEIIECRESHYKINFLLDTIYYRGCTNKKEIWFSESYRNYTSILHKRMELIKFYYKDEKEISVWKKF